MRVLHEVTNSSDCVFKRTWRAKLSTDDTDKLTLSSAVNAGSTFVLPSANISTSGKLVVEAILPKGIGMRPIVKLVKEKEDIHREIVVFSGVGEQPDSLQIPGKESESHLHMKAFPCINDLTKDIHTYALTWDDGWFRWYLDGVFYLEQHRTSFFTMTSGYSFNVQIALEHANTTNTTIDSTMTIADISLFKQTSGLCTPITINPSDCSNYQTRAILPTAPRGSLYGSLAYKEILEYVESIPSRLKSYPHLHKQTIIGYSRQDRPIVALCLGQCHPTKGEPPQTLYTAMHHSREPMSMMNLVYFIEYLLLGFHQRDPGTVHMLLTRQFWFVLVVNPDGYVYNEENLVSLHKVNPGYSGQRKNRREAQCRIKEDWGVDLNRNYDICFNETAVAGSSTDECAEDYRGTAPFSEPETQAIKSFVENNTFTTALNYHSFGKYFNIPFACQPKGTPNDADMKIFTTLANEMTKYNRFDFGQSWKTSNLYSVNGETSDWMWNTYKIFAMSPETGPAFEFQDMEGFWPSKPELIHQICEELLYSNWHIARVAGPIFNVNFLGWENDEEYVSISLELSNLGLQYVHSAEVIGSVFINGSISSPVATVGLAGIHQDQPQVRTIVLDIPKASTSESSPLAVYIVVRDQHSCQLYRTSLGKKSDEFVLWDPLPLPRCGTCAEFGGSTGNATVNCDGLGDIMFVADTPILDDVTSVESYRVNGTTPDDF
ncbi:hypothetical protein THRCLA_10487, partial [Thraustotheca clavata]